MVFQEGALFDSLSVYDNVAFRLHEQGVPEEEVEPEVRRMLRFVNLEDAIDKMPIELSGGMRRRVGIARALVCEKEGERLCLINTKVLMLRDGHPIFSGTDETLNKAEDPYIQRFLRGH